jgi:adenylosuccinate synthase
VPVTVVVGGQFGSEGKGKVAHWLAKEMEASAVVRVGGSNSGHTVISPEGEAIVLRHLPTAAILPDVKCILPAGSYLDPDVLLKEVIHTRLSDDRLFIDPNAVLITQEEKLQEQSSHLKEAIGSTLSGTGAAVRGRIERNSSIKLAENDDRLSKYIKPVVPFMRKYLNLNKRIIIEGTQGFGLSLLHSTDFPYVTSRDTGAAGFVSEAGLSPLDVDDIVLVLRTYPIRVAGNSGPLPNETNWQEVSRLSGSNLSILEHTSVTKLVRRVAHFHPDVVKRAIEYNSPTRIVLNHIDYIDNQCSILDALTKKADSFAKRIEDLIDRPVDLFGFSPSSLVVRKQAKENLVLT